MAFPLINAFRWFLMSVKSMASGWSKFTEDRSSIVKLDKWLQQATKANVSLPHAMSLATVDEKGCPSARMVLLKYLSDEGLIFFTDYLSKKGYYEHTLEGFKKTIKNDSLIEFIDKSKNLYKIICIGGSSTHCQEMPSYHLTWPSLLNKKSPGTLDLTCNNHPGITLPLSS